MASFLEDGADFPSEVHPLITSLSDDDLHLITQITESISVKVVEELTSACAMLAYVTSPPAPIINISAERERERQEQILNEELTKMLSRSTLDKFGARAPISAILPGVLPYPSCFSLWLELTVAVSPIAGNVPKYSQGTTPGAHVIVPGKLVKMEHVPVGLIPTSEFIETLTGVLRASIVRKSYDKGQDVLDTFHREIDLHVSKEGHSSREDVCELKMLQEDYLWTPSRDKKLVTNFEWQCSKCGGRHTFQVLN
jgi:hypothetical protein